MYIGMMKLNRAKLIKAANESFAERNMMVRIRYNREYAEYQVCYSGTFSPADSLTDAIYTAIATADVLFRIACVKG